MICADKIGFIFTALLTETNKTNVKSQYIFSIDTSYAGWGGEGNGEGGVLVG